MKTNKLSLILGLVIASIAFTLTFTAIGHADEFDQSTTFTFSAPVRIPGNKVLPAGTYLFKLADSDFDQNIVQIFNSEGTRLYATVLTNPTDRPEPTGDTKVTLAEQEPGRADALLTWFYPGRLTGHEFVYSRHEEEQLAHDTQQTVAANQQTAASSATGLGIASRIVLEGAGL
jgi:hypothetical protein